MDVFVPKSEERVRRMSQNNGKPMGNQWDKHGNTVLDLENMETMGKQWENNGTKYDSYMDTFLRSDNYKNNGGNWENNGETMGQNKTQTWIFLS
jgi:hypothetical protein